MEGRGVKNDCGDIEEAMVKKPLLMPYESKRDMMIDRNLHRKSRMTDKYICTISSRVTQG